MYQSGPPSFSSSVFVTCLGHGRSTFFSSTEHTRVLNTSHGRSSKIFCFPTVWFIVPRGRNSVVYANERPLRNVACVTRLSCRKVANYLLYHYHQILGRGLKSLSWLYHLSLVEANFVKVWTKVCFVYNWTCYRYLGVMLGCSVRL